MGAEASYLRVIELIEASGRLTSPRLARAQAGLATTYYAGKRYDLAAAHYEQAIALARREQGLFTEEQMPFLEKYADSLTELGRLDDALRARALHPARVERKYGATQPALRAGTRVHRALVREDRVLRRGARGAAQRHRDHRGPRRARTPRNSSAR